MDSNVNNTAKFDYKLESLNEAREIISQVYESLKEKGYNPKYYNFFNDGMRWSTCCEFS